MFHYIIHQWDEFVLDSFPGLYLEYKTLVLKWLWEKNHVQQNPFQAPMLIVHTEKTQGKGATKAAHYLVEQWEQAKQWQWKTEWDH